MSRTPVRAPAAGKQTAALAGEPRAPGEAVRYLRSCKCKALLFSKDAKHAKQTVSALMAQQSSWAPEQAEGPRLKLLLLRVLRQRLEKYEKKDRAAGTPTYLPGTPPSLPSVCWGFPSAVGVYFVITSHIVNTRITN